MISPFKKALLCLAVVCSSVTVACAQATFLEVGSTPYDRQMERVQPTLTAPSAYAMYGPSLSSVNAWMFELRSMPYRYSREWRTPEEVEITQVGDCKAKAVALYERMQLNGATNIRLVIGKRRAGDSLTHAWVEWNTEIGTLLLDPTFNWGAAFKLRNRRTYIAYYGYEGAHKYQAADVLLTGRNLSATAPAAPAHGMVNRAIRPGPQFRTSPWLFDEGPIDPRFFARRPAL